MEAMGLAIPCPSRSGAEPCTLHASVAMSVRVKTDSRLSHDKVVAGVDGGHETE